MSSLFDGTYHTDNVNEIYDRMEANYSSSPHSKSKKLWLRRHACKISPDNTSPETMLEKAVAMLAERRHMPGWSNQCPVASGIVSHDSDRKRAVDLVHWSKSNKHARLVELKWGSDNPLSAQRQIIRYGVAYIFCRIHRKELPLLGRSLMDARHISLEVIAPLEFFFNDPYQKDDLPQVSKSLDEFAASKTGGTLSMSLKMFAFPEEFDQVPFKNGQDVRKKCDTNTLTEEGRKVRDAFDNLTLNPPSSSEWWDAMLS